MVEMEGRNTTALIDEILLGDRDSLWLIGRPGIGKTSLLRRIERATLDDSSLGYFPVYWDLSGLADIDDLGKSFLDRLDTVAERLVDRGFELRAVRGDDPFRALSMLRQSLRSRGCKLLLLCDGGEGLVPLRRRDPSAIARLRRVLQSADDVRSVLTSTMALWALATRGDASSSSFLQGVIPPLYLGALSDGEARALMRSVAGFVDRDRTVAAIREQTGNHPLLLLQLCRRVVALGSVDDAAEQTIDDPTVRAVLSHDLAALSAIRTRAGRGADRVDGAVLQLEHLGLVSEGDEARLSITGTLVRRWLREQPLDDREARVMTMSCDELHGMLSLGLSGHKGSTSP
jgi:hypothetical protein